MHGTIPTELVRLIHPITGRFVAEYDPLRGLLLVVDRGKRAIIDLVRVDGEARRASEGAQEAQEHGETNNGQ